MNKFVAGVVGAMGFVWWTGYVYSKGVDCGYDKARKMIEFAYKVAETVKKEEEA